VVRISIFAYSWVPEPIAAPPVLAADLQPSHGQTAHAVLSQGEDPLWPGRVDDDRSLTSSPRWLTWLVACARPGRPLAHSDQNRTTNKPW
jgi:hypothetical protein